MDLYLIHWPINQPGTPGYTTAADHGMPTNEAAWAILEQLHDEGLAKSIGVSNYRIEDLEKTLKVARIRPSCNQIEMHPYVLKQSAPLLEYRTSSPSLPSLLPPSLRRSLPHFSCIHVLTTHSTVAKEGIRVEAYGPTTPLTKFVGPSPPPLSLSPLTQSSHRRTPGPHLIQDSYLRLLPLRNPRRSFSNPPSLRFSKWLYSNHDEWKRLEDEAVTSPPSFSPNDEN